MPYKWHLKKWLKENTEISKLLEVYTGFMEKSVNKRPPKTLKEKKFVQEYLKTGNATEAASRSYLVKNRNVAKVIGAQNLTKLNFTDYFDQLGLDDQSLVGSLIEATHATRYSYDQEAPDWNNRLKALELCMRLKGTFSKAEQQQSEPIYSSDDEDESSPVMIKMVKWFVGIKVDEYKQELSGMVGKSMTPDLQMKVKVIELFQALEEIEPNLLVNDLAE